MSVGTKLLQAAAGNAGEAVYVDDVFSTTLYTGTDGSVVVPTGLDLADKGGLIWGKSRSASQNHRLYDSARGTQYSLISNATSAQSDQGTQAFGSSSVTLGAASGIVGSSSYGGPDYVLWSFAKQEKFFDIVTYTGDGTTGRQIAHNLGSSPGMMFFKKTNGTGDWKVFHRSLSGSGLNGRLRLDSTGAEVTLTNNFFVSSTYFGSDYYNASGDEWVVYLFAHDEQDFGKNSDEAIIKCGSYTGSGSTGKFVDLGFEPQWVLVKNTDAGTPWVIIDIMRGMPVGGDGVRLLADQNVAEVSSASYFAPRPTGMEVTQQNTYVNTSGEDYIYMAIRRPNKPASEFAANKLFSMDGAGNASGDPDFVSNDHVVDMAFLKLLAGTESAYLTARLTENQYINLAATSTEATDGALDMDFQSGFGDSPSSAVANYQAWMFRRVKGFFDVVTYDGTGSDRTQAHNLGVAPELILIKRRGPSNADWVWYVGPLGTGKYMYGDAGAELSSTTIWSNTAPTSSVFSLGNQGGGGTYRINGSGSTYIAFLWATVAGISKVGSYTGSDTDQTIDCGFSNGARFILIKRTDSSGGWYVLDSERGLSTGSDPYFQLNSADAQSTGNMINVRSSGFGVSAGAGSGGNSTININSASYIFLAIA